MNGNIAVLLIIALVTTALGLAGFAVTWVLRTRFGKPALTRRQAYSRLAIFVVAAFSILFAVVFVTAVVVVYRGFQQPWRPG